MRRIACDRDGFTLLELMIVVIIVGILSSVALPTYTKTIERSRQAEALTVLGMLRGAEYRYRGLTGVYTNDLSRLDLEDPNSMLHRYFDYVVSTSAGNQQFLARATRNSLRRSSTVGAYAITINQDGTLVQPAAF